MQSLRSALRLGCAVRFHDRWQGRLASLEVDDEWTVVNVVLSRGVLRPTSVKMPFSVVSHWDDDSIALDCTSGSAFGRQIPPVAFPPRPLSTETPVSAAGYRLAGALVDRTSRRAGHLLLATGLLAAEKRMIPVQDVALEAGVCRLTIPPEDLPLYRRDSRIEADVWDALASHRYLTADDLRGLDVGVADGTVHLTGNVRTPQGAANAREAAGAVVGVLDIRDDVVDDHRLEIEVGHALDAAGLYRYGRFYVRAALGAVALGGIADSETVVRDAVKFASAVPGVASVNSSIETGRASSAPPPTAEAAAQGSAGA